MIRPPRIPTLFPYTPLSRSLLSVLHRARRVVGDRNPVRRPRRERRQARAVHDLGHVLGKRADGGRRLRQRGIAAEQITVIFERSEEHTSELQSQSNLVCRLL